MTYSSVPNSLVNFTSVNNFSPFNTDIPDPSYEVKVSVTVPSGGAMILAAPTTTPGTVISDNFEPNDLKKFSRIMVEIKIENVTQQNLGTILDAIKAEVSGKATNLLNMPEAV